MGGSARRLLRIEGDIAYIPLASTHLEAVIDVADAPLVEGRNWHLKSDHGLTYARCCVTKNGKRSRLYLHRVITGVADGLMVDHRDGNGLNCRRYNMRPATRLQNAWNRKSNINPNGKGVAADGQFWRATIRANGVYYQLGTYLTAAEARAAYAGASKVLHGKFSVTERLDTPAQTGT